MSKLKQQAAEAEASRRIRVRNASFNNEEAETWGSENQLSQAKDIPVDTMSVVLTVHLALF